MRKIHPFLSYFTRRKLVKVSIISGATFIIATLIDAVFFLDVLNIFTDDFIDAAMLLRMTYESTLIFIGYAILLFGMLSSAFAMLRDHKCKSNSKKLQIQFIILTFTFTRSSLPVAVTTSTSYPFSLIPLAIFAV
ncbi:MAG: hypothetical protein J7K81_04785 [Methanophagales archaeon]|nr:hypothetical protein [Methanophagales archaeon]